MPVDLRSNSLFSRNSLVLTDDSLVKLEHGRTEDRVRKFMFDSIETVLVWRQWPYVRMTIVTLVFVVPGALMQLSSETVIKIIGGCLLALGLGLDLFYAVCRVTTIRIVRGGEPADIKGIFRPKKVRRLIARLLDGVRRTQNDSQATDTPSATPALSP